MKNFSIGAQYEKLYTDYYADGDSEWRRLGAIDKASHIVSLCQEYPHKTILEIGAGEGSILKRLSDLNFGAQLYALEISASGVDTINNKQIPNLIECSLFDGYTIPYPDQMFDLAVLSHVVEHLEFPRRLLYEAARVARFVFVEVPLEQTMRLSNDFRIDGTGHINFYTPKSIRRFLQTCNLSVLKQIVTNSSREIYNFQKSSSAKYYLKEYLLRYLPGLAPKVFTYHCALLCQPQTSAIQETR